MTHVRRPARLAATTPEPGLARVIARVIACAIAPAIPLALLAACATTPAASRADAPTGTLVVSNMNDHTVTVIHAGSGRVIGTFPTGEGPHEVAISHAGWLAAVSNYGVQGKPGSTISLFDIGTGSRARTLTLAGFTRPHGMAFLPGDTLLAVTSEAARAIVIVDVRDGRVVDTLATRARASHMLALTAAGDRVFTANIADNNVSMIDVRGRDSTRLVPVARAPESIAVTPSGSLIWVGSNRDSTVLVLDARTGAALDTLRGFGMPYRIVLTPDERLAVISDPVRAQVRVVGVADRRPRFTLTISPDSLVPTAEVPGSASPEGVAVSRDGRWAFVTLQGRNRVITIDLERGAILRATPTGVWSDGIGWSPARWGQMLEGGGGGR